MQIIEKKIVAIYCSARRPSGSGALLDSALEPLVADGIRVQKFFVCELDIEPCAACDVCRDGSPCPIDDDMSEIYTALERADGIIISTPVYFYGLPAKAKALIDRCQTFWSRKYLLANPLPSGRPAGVIVVAASGGKLAVEGVRLTLKYFLDALSIEMSEMLEYKNFKYEPDTIPQQDIIRAGNYGKHLQSLMKGDNYENQKNSGKA